MTLGLVAVALGLSACGGNDSESDTSATSGSQSAGVRTVDVSEFEAALAADPAPTILDVRTPEEFAEGHLEGATNLDFYAESFRSELEALDRDTPYAIYCRSGNRSGQAAAIMRELGFTDVVDLDGGIVAWSAADKPLA